MVKIDGLDWIKKFIELEGGQSEDDSLYQQELEARNAGKIGDGVISYSDDVLFESDLHHSHPSGFYGTNDGREETRKTIDILADAENLTLVNVIKQRLKTENDVKKVLKEFAVTPDSHYRDLQGADNTERPPKGRVGSAGYITVDALTLGMGDYAKKVCGYAAKAADKVKNSRK